MSLAAHNEVDLKVWNSITNTNKKKKTQFAALVASDRSLKSRSTFVHQSGGRFSCPNISHMIAVCLEGLLLEANKGLRQKIC